MCGSYVYFSIVAYFHGIPHKINGGGGGSSCTILFPHTGRLLYTGVSLIVVNHHHQSRLLLGPTTVIKDIFGFVEMNICGWCFDTNDTQGNGLNNLCGFFRFAHTFRFGLPTVVHVLVVNQRN